MSGPAPLPRRSKAETRELLLLAGTLIADDLVASDAPEQLARWLAYIRLERVLEVAKQLQVYLEEHDAPAGGTALQTWLDDHRERILALDVTAYRDIAKPTAYTVFDGEDDFRERLAERLLSTDRNTSADSLQAEFAALVERHGGRLPPIGELVPALAEAELRQVRDQAAPVIELGALPFAGHPLVRALLRRTYEAPAYDQGQLVEVYDTLLATYGWRFRHGYTSLDLYSALRSLVTGLSAQHRVWPESVRDDVPWEDGTRSAFAIAVEGVVRFVAEGPEDPGAPQVGSDPGQAP